jgi:hypothetical protein
MTLRNSRAIADDARSQVQVEVQAMGDDAGPDVAQELPQIHGLLLDGEESFVGFGE